MPIIFILIVAVFQVLLVFIHLAVYATVNAVFGVDGPILRTVFILLSIAFTSASLISHWFKGKLIDWYYTASAYWFGLIHFLFGGVVVFLFTANILYAFNYYVSPAVLVSISFAIFFLIHLYGTWLSGRTVVTKVNVALSGLPAAWQGKQIVFVSDLHLGNIRHAGFAKKMVQKIGALKPEAIFIGGDLYDGTACDPAELIAPLRAFRAPQGVYFVTGNHDHFLIDLKGALAAIRDVGIRILDNEKIDLGGLTFFGVDDRATHRAADYAKVFAQAGLHKGGNATTPTTPVILIKHEPSHMTLARDVGISFGIFGHTHHGQIFPLNFFIRQIYKGLGRGFKRFGEMQIYTSSGVGTWGPPLRLGTKSEVVLITLSRPDASGSVRA